MIVRRRMFFGLALAVAALNGACGEQKKPAPVSQRERDSLIGASKLPGAAGVRGALAVQDSATRRKAILDSIARADSR